MHESSLRCRSGLVLVLLGCRGHDPHPSDVTNRPRPVGIVTYDDDIVVVFRALDCQLFAKSFARVDSMAVANHLLIRGVMLLGPVVGTEARRVLADLGVTFPVQPDSVGTWNGLFGTIGTHGPALVLAKRGTIAAIYFGYGAFDALPFPKGFTYRLGT